MDNRTFKPYSSEMFRLLADTGEFYEIKSVPAICLLSLFIGLLKNDGGELDLSDTRWDRREEYQKTLRGKDLAGISKLFSILENLNILVSFRKKNLRYRSFSSEYVEWAKSRIKAYRVEFQTQNLTPNKVEFQSRKPTPKKLSFRSQHLTPVECQSQNPTSPIPQSASVSLDKHVERDLKGAFAGTSDEKWSSELSTCEVPNSEPRSIIEELQSRNSKDPQIPPHALWITPAAPIQVVAPQDAKSNQRPAYEAFIRTRDFKGLVANAIVMFTAECEMRKRSGENPERFTDWKYLGDELGPYLRSVHDAARKRKISPRAWNDEGLFSSQMRREIEDIAKGFHSLKELGFPEKLGFSDLEEFLRKTPESREGEFDLADSN